jgi:hypothetical protein
MLIIIRFSLAQSSISEEILGRMFAQFLSEFGREIRAGFTRVSRFVASEKGPLSLGRFALAIVAAH